MVPKPIRGRGRQASDRPYLDLFGGLLGNDVHHVVGGDDPLHAAGVVDDGKGEETGALEELAHILLRRVVGHGHDARPHDVAQPAAGVGVEELAEGHHADEALIGFEDVAVVDHLDLCPPLLRR